MSHLLFPIRIKSTLWPFRFPIIPTSAKLRSATGLYTHTHTHTHIQSYVHTYVRMQRINNTHIVQYILAPRQFSLMCSHSLRDIRERERHKRKTIGSETRIMTVMCTYIYLINLAVMIANTRTLSTIASVAYKMCNVAEHVFQGSMKGALRIALTLNHMLWRRGVSVNASTPASVCTPPRIHNAIVVAVDNANATRYTARLIAMMCVQSAESKRYNAFPGLERGRGTVDSRRLDDERLYPLCVALEACHHREECSQGCTIFHARLLLPSMVVSL